MTPGLNVLPVTASKYRVKARSAERQRSPRSRRLYLKEIRSTLDARAAAGGEALDAHHTLHALLGESLGAGFSFIGENHVRRGLQSLDGKKLLVAPEFGYISGPFARCASSAKRAMPIPSSRPRDPPSSSPMRTANRRLTAGASAKARSSSSAPCRFRTASWRSPPRAGKNSSRP